MVTLPLCPSVSVSPVLFCCGKNDYTCNIKALNKLWAEQLKFSNIIASTSKTLITGHLADRLTLLQIYYMNVVQVKLIIIKNKKYNKNKTWRYLQKRNLKYYWSVLSLSYLFFIPLKQCFEQRWKAVFCYNMQRIQQLKKIF